MKLSQIFEKEVETSVELDKDRPNHSENDKQTLINLFADADKNNLLKAYTNKQTYQIKQAQEHEEVHINFPGEVTKKTNAKAGQYILRMPESINKIKLLSSEDFENNYELVSANEKPDAEGFLDYIEKGEILAFMYPENEPLDLTISGHFIKVTPNDYIGYDVTNPKLLIVLPKVKFEQQYKLS
jgi:hypothetical protein